MAIKVFLWNKKSLNDILFTQFENQFLKSQKWLPFFAMKKDHRVRKNSKEHKKLWASPKQLATVVFRKLCIINQCCCIKMYVFCVWVCACLKLRSVTIFGISILVWKKFWIVKKILSSHMRWKRAIDIEKLIVKIQCHNI